MQSVFTSFSRAPGVLVTKHNFSRCRSHDVRFSHTAKISTGEAHLRSKLTNHHRHHQHYRRMPDPRAEDLFGLNDHGDDSDAGIGSADEQEESRTTGPSRSAKRRKVTHDSDSASDAGSGSDGSEKSDDEQNGSELDEEEEEDEDGEGDNIPGNKKISKSSTKLPSKDPSLITNPAHLTPLTPAQLAASRLTTKKSGVVYLSSVPPFMRPQKVKALLSRFGEINRIFLSPEDPTSHRKRVKFGGNKKINYEEGWVEFTDKKIAKLVAETLNATIVGGKKNNYYHDDVWNIKYLPKFKWHHLTAQIALENASRESRLRAEIAQAHRENKTFTRNVERAKMIEHMQETRKRKAEAAGPKDKSAPSVASDAGTSAIEVRRHFRQNKIKGHKAAQAEGVKSSEVVKKALGKLF